MRSVVGALFRALPGLGSIVAVLLLVFCIAAVMATKLFGSEFPQWFGNIGESMFSRQRDSSKIALVMACRVLSHWGYPIIDCQVENPHLMSMGAEIMNRDDFLGQLRSLISIGGRKGSWTREFTRAMNKLEPRG